MKNKKIKNATPKIVDGVKFKSTIEAILYKYMKDKGLNPLYEHDKFILVEGIKPNVLFLRKTRNKYIDNGKIRDITYTPDFTIYLNNITLYVEVKGIPNDVYPIKRKLFRLYLENIKSNKVQIYIEVKNKTDIDNCFSIIKNEYPSENI